MSEVEKGLNEGDMYIRDKKELISDSIEKSIALFYQKHWKIPDICHVHPSELAEKEIPDIQKILGIEIVLDDKIPVHHIWIGNFVEGTTEYFVDREKF